MESQSDAILSTYFAVCQKYKKPYCLQSQAHTLRLLGKYHKTYISLRTLNRRLRELEDGGYIRRVRRHKEGEDGKIVFKSTLSHLQARAFDWMARSLERAARVFSLFRLPKLAAYRFNTTRYPSAVDNLSGCITTFLSRGAPAAVFRTA